MCLSDSLLFYCRYQQWSPPTQMNGQEHAEAAVVAAAVASSAAVTPSSSGSCFFISQWCSFILIPSSMIIWYQHQKDWFRRCRKCWLVWPRLSGDNNNGTSSNNKIKTTIIMITVLAIIDDSHLAKRNLYRQVITVSCQCRLLSPQQRSLIFKKPQLQKSSPNIFSHFPQISRAWLGRNIQQSELGLGHGPTFSPTDHFLEPE